VAQVIGLEFKVQAQYQKKKKPNVTDGDPKSTSSVLLSYVYHLTNVLVSFFLFLFFFSGGCGGTGV
jgi:hypothetical protein